MPIGEVQKLTGEIQQLFKSYTFGARRNTFTFNLINRKSMALSVTDVELLRGYINGVMARADHHAGNVKEIALALTGAILWRKDDGIAIRVMTRNGETKNVLWVMIGGQWYTLVYNHDTGEIDMRENSTQGATLHSFSNTTPLVDVHSIFQAL